ncbi:uncharacterized protein MELLADRAFT_109294 [Melampsora larici-populina 98AG31]|uniref:Ino eighty subunit 1 n=1 Tax=Melampsora larici-populina (strain 98AG31 / pathotype 3-4-7) TaxID=747676 RepID=F4RW05_MELLP|nr:uncharacterized protein MELLADRAFT_109294 [Melampsora larici-populina 98AG31]EGG03492.1 hypothetical protein MELLADRAFT_109294 [Melampsora larici-populina 98AG31]
MPAPKKNRAQLPPNQSNAPNATKDTPGWALKKADGEMFTRADIQYDLMSDIFNDRTFQFTSPLDQRAVSFKELYVETLSKFSKAAKSTVRQLDENPNWATNFCIASFLINIGRINTTVAYHGMRLTTRNELVYPELRAYMRTYHPIPCLQKDEYCKTNLQDAPRIKTMLKSCQLPYEVNNEAGSLPEISNRSAHGLRPPTTVVNLIFELFNVEPYVSAKYFPEGFVLHDLFSPTTIPTKLRAYAFLWLMHHFLEDPSSAADFTVETKIQAFQLARLEDIHPSARLPDNIENIDLDDEVNGVKKCNCEEGIGFIDDLPNSGITALTEDANLTKKQKIMVQNYAQSIETEDLPKSSAGASGQLRLSATSSRADPRNGGANDIPPVKANTVVKTQLTHLERLQSAIDAMTKYGDDEDLDADEDSLTPIQLAWKRNQNDIAQNRDVAYDSDDSSKWTAPDWKPKELKNRLLGFVFPTSDDDSKDQVIRFQSNRKPTITSSTYRTLSKNPISSINLSKTNSNLSNLSMPSNSNPPLVNSIEKIKDSNHLNPSNSPKRKRKRKVIETNQLQPQPQVNQQPQPHLTSNQIDQNPNQERITTS